MEAVRSCDIYLSTKLHGVTTQKAVIFIVTTAKFSNLTHRILHSWLFDFCSGKVLCSLSPLSLVGPNITSVLVSGREFQQRYLSVRSYGNLNKKKTHVEISSLPGCHAAYICSYIQDEREKLSWNASNYRSTLRNIPEELRFHSRRCASLKSCIFMLYMRSWSRAL